MNHPDVVVIGAGQNGLRSRLLKWTAHSPVNFDSGTHPGPGVSMGSARNATSVLAGSLGLAFPGQDEEEAHVRCRDRNILVQFFSQCSDSQFRSYSGKIV